MKYKNTETGAIVDVRSELSGAWVPVEEEPKKQKETADKDKKQEK